MPPSPIPTEPAPQDAASRTRFVVVGIGVAALLAVVLGIWWMFHIGYAQSLYRSAFSGGAVNKSVIEAIKEDYMQSVVMVACFDESGVESGHGSGVYFVSEDGKPMVETNAHVVLASDGEFYGCNVYFPRIPDGTFYSSAYFAERGHVYHDKQARIGDQTVEGLDYAMLELTEAYSTPEGVLYPFPPAQRSVYDTQQEVCKEGGYTLDLTDEILMLGYPAVGDKSITVTDGIVSGFTPDMIKVSAITNPGVSGGIVISPLTGCMIGIPTIVSGGLGGGIGYIIAESYKQAFLTGLTGEGTYGARASSERLVDYTAPSGVTFLRPEFWEPEPVDQKSIILKPSARFDLAPGITIEELPDGNIRVVNPGGVEFHAPPEDIFDDSDANFRFLESEMPGETLTEALGAIMHGDQFLFGNDIQFTIEPRPFRTEEGFPAMEFQFLVPDYGSGEMHLYHQAVILGRGRLYQFIFTMRVPELDEEGALPQKYADTLEKLKKVARSVKVR